MCLPRSTYYDTPATEADTEIVARITAICEEFQAYGYRRVGAELRHQGIVVNGKKIRRLMRQHDLQPKRRGRFIATTDSDHDSPIFSNRAKDVTADRPNQLWVADITYAAIAVGFVYAAVILTRGPLIQNILRTYIPTGGVSRISRIHFCMTTPLRSVD